MRWIAVAIAVLFGLLLAQDFAPSASGAWTPALSQGEDAGDRFGWFEPREPDPGHDHRVEEHLSTAHGDDWCRMSTGADRDGDGYVDQVPCDDQTRAKAEQMLAATHNNGAEVAP